MIDLDEKTAQGKVVAAGRVGWIPWIASFAGAFAGVVGVMMLGVLAYGPAVAPDEPVGPQPVFEVYAEVTPATAGADDPQPWIPTITAYFADGTTADPYPLSQMQRWQPDREIRMLTVVASASCTIVVDGETAVMQNAPLNRAAVCVWVAP